MEAVHGVTYLNKHPFATTCQHDMPKAHQPVVTNGVDQPINAQMVARPLPSTSAHPALAYYAQVRHELFQSTQWTHSHKGIMVVWRRLRDEWLHRLALVVGRFHLQVVTTVGCSRIL